MDRQFQNEDLSSLPPRVLAAFAPPAARDEEKEDEGIVENRETDLGTVGA
jgi:hypothetical protein